MTEQSTSGKRPKARARGGTSDKIWAAGLAGVTCVGLVGTIGVRLAQEAAANTNTPESITVAPEDPINVDVVSTSTGLTEQQLDGYARALEEERIRLEAYHAELLDAAAQLQQAVDALSGSQSVIPARAAGQANQAKQAKPANQGKKGKKSIEPVTAAAQPQVGPSESSMAVAPAAKPVPKPAAAPQVVKPQAQTRGS